MKDKDMSLLMGQASFIFALCVEQYLETKVLASTNAIYADIIRRWCASVLASSFT